MPLGNSQIRHLADLARLKFSDREIEKLASQFEGVVAHFQIVSDVDTSTVDGVTGPLPEDSLRADVIQPSLSQEEALANAAENDGEFFKVPGVIRR